MRWPFLGALVAVSAVAWAGSAHGGDQNPILEVVNAQRQANGIPPVAWNQDWAAKCLLHDQYAIANNGWDSPNPHGETPGKTAYTADGDWAGAHSVLTRDVFSTTPGEGGFADPFEWAPIHLIQMMSPSITEMGGATLSSWTCLTTWPGYQKPEVSETPRFFSYPGDGTTGIYAREVAAEGPTTPEKELGLGDRAVTGPNIFVYAEGFTSRDTVTAATLTDDLGRATELAWWDADLSSLAGYNPAGSVMLIPKNALIGRTHYKVSVSLADPRSAVTALKYNPTTRKYERIVVTPAHNAVAQFAFGFTTGACSACLHLPDHGAGLLEVKSANAPGKFVVVSNGETTAHLFVAQLRHGVRAHGSCRFTPANQSTRGKSVCAGWSKIGRFEHPPFGDGETEVSLRSILRHAKAGRYRITVAPAGGSAPQTIEIALS
jgi:hypothetical protein